MADTTLVIGRGDDCHIIVREPYVSRRHCEIHSEAGVPYIVDLGSSNTTLVNGVAVSRSALEVGDELAVGGAVFMVAYGGATVDEARYEVPDHDTVSIAIGDSAYLRDERQQSVAEGRPRTVVDLSNLFHFARNLGKAEEVRQVIEMLAREIAIQLRASEYWIFRWVEGEDEALVPWYPEASKQSNGTLAPGEAMRNAANARSGELVANVQRGEGEAERYTLVAPIALGDRVLGVVASRAPLETRTEAHADLELLMALAATAAPYIISVEIIERLRTENARLKAEVGEPAGFLGDSRAAHRTRELARTAAHSGLPVLIRGETGTGKEVVARMIHDLSDRAENEFVVINCAAIPVTLFESELFGHERGAFSGAATTRMGRLEQADRGTLFLDEVGDLSIESQAKLLRAIELGEFQRVGGNETRTVDIRVVSATNRDLEAAVNEGQFREDLYHRLNTFEIHIPPLRERKADIPALAQHFLQLSAEKAGRNGLTLSDEAMAHLRGLRWPGNVRQLRQCLERAVAMAKTDRVTPREIDFQTGGEHGDGEAEPVLSMQDVERQHIEAVLRRCEGRVAEAARLLGMGRTTVYNKINEYQIKV